MRLRSNSSLPRVGIAAAMAFGSLVVGASAGVVEAVPGETITGLVFRDDGHDGSKAGDPGDAGIEVTVIDSGGATASATSGVTGAYSVDLAALDAGPYTVRFDIPSTITYLKPGPIGPDNRTDTRIVPAGNATNVDFGVVNPADFCQANPDVITNCFQEGDQSGTGRTLLESTFNASGDGNGGVGQSPLSLENEIGTTFGLAVQTFFDNDGTNDIIYASAFTKRFAGYGPGGIDAIYQLDRNGDVLNTITSVDAGIDVHDFTTVNAGGDVIDGAVYGEVGKSGWGDIDLSEDGSTLYAVNLFDRTLYAFDVSGGSASVPTQSDSWALTALPGQTCTTGNIRPWAVGVNDGQVYVGSVCDAQGGTAAALQAHIHALDPVTDTFTNIQSFPLNYTREQVSIDRTAAAAALASADWRPWDDVWGPELTGWEAIFPGSDEYADPQPMLSDIEFLANGDIVLGLRDRYGDQAGDQAPNPQNPADTTEYRTDAAGDTLHMCRTAPGTWQIENGTTCVSNDNDGELDSGPGGREYYNGDLYITNVGAGPEVGHYEISLGGLVSIDQNTNVLATGYDTIDDGDFGVGNAAFSQGLFRLDGASGDRTGGYRIIDASGGFGKANGLGDIEAICDSAPLEIGNYVWFDVDGDGVQDPDEVPLQGVSVQLVDDLGAPVGAPVITGADGYYSFPVDPLTDYTVTFDATAATDPTGTYTITGALLLPTDEDQGSSDELDSDIVDLLGVNTIAVTTGTAGDNDHSFDAGFVLPSVSVGDFVFIDVNRDGIQDGGDTPVEDATLTLTGPGGGAVTDIFGNPVLPVQTDAAGAYNFANLPTLAAGESYTVTIDPSTAPALAGFVPTLTGQGTPAIDSSTGSAASGDLTIDGARDATLDFGFVSPSVSVGDYVFIDENRDGIQQVGDTPVEDATLTLTGPGGGAVTDVFGNPVPSVQTDAAGVYTFDNLPVLAAGESYTVTIDPSTAPALVGFVPTLTGQGTPVTDSSTGSAASGDLTVDGARDSTLDFGFVSPSVSVGDFVFIDTNGDGIQNGGDTPVEDATLTLTGPGGGAVTDVFGNPVAPVQTDAAGAYTFDNLPALAAGESYTVTIDPSTAPALAGFVPTQTGQGTPATDSSTGSAASGDLIVDGARDATLDFGFVPGSVSVGDFVFIDVNRDGIQDGGDLPVEDATLTLTGPGGGAVTDIFGNPVPPVQTDAAGAYTFANLPVLAAGESYTVAIDPSTAPVLAGFVPTLTGQGTTATDSSTGSASSGDLTVIGARDATLDFGFVSPSVSVGDFVFIDENRDGIQQVGDTPVEDATLTLTGPGGGAVTDVFGNPVAPVQTDAAGAYTFDNLPVLAAGESYTVTIDPSTAPALSGFVPTLTGQGTVATDSSTGSAASGDLIVDGARDSTLDFGFVSPSVSVGDFVFIDENGDGIQDGGDTPVEDATLTLTGPGGGAVTDVFGNPVPPVQTDAAGAYTFDNLPALAAGESYTVTIDPSTAPALVGFVPTQTGQGTPATDSSTGSAASGDLIVDGARDATLDFGFVPGSVSVGDFVFIDVNRDGIQDGGDLPVQFATLTLTDPSGDPVVDVFGNPVPPVQTDAAGAYNFANLPTLAAGESYTVTIDPSTAPALSGFVPTLTGQGTPATDSSTGSAASGDLTLIGDRDATLDFGFVSPAVSVGDYVFIDENRDGIQQAGDTPVEDATLTLTGPGGGAVTDVFGNPVPSVQTDAAGAYTFDDLPALAAGESYTVTIDPSTAPALAGFVPTQTGQGTPATDSSTGSAASGDLIVDGARDATLDFGFVSPSVSVGDFVFIDTNGDGIQDGGDLPVQFATLTLTDPSGDPVVDVFGNPVPPVQTDAAGAYNFVNLPTLAAGESYTVTIDPSTAPALAGFVPTQTGQGTPATDSSTGSAASGDLIVDGARDATLDFGFVPGSVSVGDFVFIDVNRDGIQDGGDLPVEDATLTLTGPGGGAVTDIFGNPVPPVQTDAAGAYNFANLPTLAAGESYTVTIDPSTAPTLTGFVPTLTGQGTPATDSSTGLAASGDLTVDGQSDSTLDFGFVVRAVSVGDFVFIDLNRDGIQDGGDLPVEDATLTLTGPGGGAVTDIFGNPVAPVQTDAAGAYTFDDLPALAAGESYTVTIDPSTAPTLVGYLPTLTGQGTPATDSSTGSAASGDLVNNGDRDATLDFGFVPPSVSLGDFVFIDVNRDGIQDGGDLPVQFATLTLTDPSGDPVVDVFGNPVPPVQTDAAGAYSFANLPALAAGESYTVTIDPSTAPALAGFVSTLTGQGTPATDSSTGTASSGDLVNDGDSDTTLDFGFVSPSVALGDFVFIDTNGDGVQDGGDTPVQGATLTLTDPNGDPVVDVFGNPVPPVQTDINGLYSFDDLPTLPPGQSYTVTIDPSTAPVLDGFVPTRTGEGTPATDSSSGSADSGDLTDDGDSDDTMDFGFVPPSVSLGDFVFLDVDRDGVQDSGDTPVPGATLTLTDPNGDPVIDVFGNPVPPVQTDADGSYSFNVLPILAPGESYTVTIDPSTAPLLDGALPTQTGQGTTATDSSTGSADSGDLVNNGDRDDTLDFGFVTPSVSVGDFVFIDTNRDGVQDPGDTPVSGATLTLTGPDGDPVTDVFGNPVPSVQTDADGMYSFDDLPTLPPGESYTVTIDPSTAPALTGYLPTQTGQGTPSTDSSTGSADSGDLTEDGDSDDTMDFGFVPGAVSVGDRVFIDTNRDGVQDAGDTPVPGATLTLTGPDGGPVTNIFGDVVGSTVTDANGVYSFDDLPVLPPGQSYTVTIDPSTAPSLAGLLPTLPGVGTPATDSSSGSASSTGLNMDGDRDDTLDFGFIVPDDLLPATGGSIWSSLRYAMFAVAAGLFLLIAGRRRRRSDMPVAG